MFREIHVRDCDGSNVLRYICLPDNRYFGGNTHPSVTFDHGPHIYHGPESLMALFAQVAHAAGNPACPFRVSSTDSYETPLLPEGTRADYLASILGIPQENVVNYYGLLLKIEA